MVTLVSDLSGRPIDEAGATVRFGLDGTSYEVDLTAQEQDALRQALASYIDAARKVGNDRRHGTPATRSSTSSAPSPSEIRNWAVENGHEVPARGRIPALVREAYDAAH